VVLICWWVGGSACWCFAPRKMAIKTRDGWKTRRQMAAQDKAWRGARKQLMEKIGKTHLNDQGEVKKRASEIFTEIDTDGNGKIDVAELKVAMGNLGVNLKQGEAESMMREADADGDMLMDVEEFIDVCWEEVQRFRNVTQSQSCSLM